MLRLPDSVRHLFAAHNDRSPGALARLDLLVVAIAAAGAIVLVALDFYRRHIVKDVIEIFDIDGQGNPTTWFHSSILLGAALCALFVGAAATERGRRARWVVLGACLAFFSLDKAISLHERVGRELVDAFSLSDGAARIAWQAAWSPIILTTAVILVVAARESGPRTRFWLLLMLLGGGTKLGLEALMFPLTEYGGIGETGGLVYGLEVEIEETVQLMAFACMFAAFVQLAVDTIVAAARDVAEAPGDEPEEAAGIIIPLDDARRSRGARTVTPAARDTHRT